MTSPLHPRSATDPEVPLRQFAAQHIVELHRPDSIAALFKAAVLVLERSIQQYLAPSEPNRPGRADQPNQVMARVLGLRQRPGILALRRVPPTRWRLLVQRL